MRPMNDFYDYMIIRIYGWYQSFENEPSLFTARLIIAINQSVIILCLVAPLNSLIVMPRLLFTTIGVMFLVIFYLRLHFRFPAESSLEPLLSKWSNEKSDLKTLKGYVVAVMVFAPMILFVVIVNILH